MSHPVESEPRPIMPDLTGLDDRAFRALSADIRQLQAHWDEKPADYFTPEGYLQHRIDAESDPERRKDLEGKLSELRELQGKHSWFTPRLSDTERKLEHDLSSGLSAVASDSFTDDEEASLTHYVDTRQSEPTSVDMLNEELRRRNEPYLPDESTQNA